MLLLDLLSSLFLLELLSCLKFQKDSMSDSAFLLPLRHWMSWN